MSVAFAGCATKGMNQNAERIQALEAGANGGFTFHVARSPNVPCTSLRLTLAETDTGDTISAESHNGMFGTGAKMEIVGAVPGEYIPTSINCYAESTSGSFRRTYNNTYKVFSGNFEPIAVQSGKVTILNSIEFVTKDRNTVEIRVQDTQSVAIKNILEKNSRFVFTPR